MQKASKDCSNLSTELVILEALINEQNQYSDQSIIPIHAINIIREYVEASEAILILFDVENPGWDSKKLLGEQQTWKSESTFPTKESALCRSMKPFWRQFSSCHYEMFEFNTISPEAFERAAKKQISPIICSNVAGVGICKQVSL